MCWREWVLGQRAVVTIEEVWWRGREKRETEKN